MTGWRVFVRFRSVQDGDLGATVRIWPVEKGMRVEISAVW
jgi:hypothetical protein